LRDGAAQRIAEAARFASDQPAQKSRAATRIFAAFGAGVPAALANKALPFGGNPRRPVQL